MRPAASSASSALCASSAPRSSAAGLAVAALSLLLAACAAPPAAAPSPPPLDEQMRQAELARIQGAPGQARALWQQAARDNPTSKLPWLQLAEDHARAGEHGSAIAAAQEAVQRDPADRDAQGLLALSGLRIATTALAGLREHPEGLPGTTRGEATSLTRLLRDALGDAAPPAPPPKPKPRVARAPAAAAAPASPTAPATAPAPAPARAVVAPPLSTPARAPVSATVPAANPFDRLR